MDSTISKYVRNIWTLSTLVIAFCILKGYFKFPENKNFTDMVSYNFLLVSVYLYGNKSIKNILPILELWLGKKGK